MACILEISLGLDVRRFNYNIHGLIRHQRPRLKYINDRVETKLTRPAREIKAKSHLLH